MSNPTLRGAPTLDEIQAIDCLFARVRRVTEFGRTVGTLPTLLARQRRADLKTLREKHSAGAIAARVNLARARIFAITRPAAGQESR